MRKIRETPIDIIGNGAMMPTKSNNHKSQIRPPASWCVIIELGQGEVDYANNCLLGRSLAGDGKARKEHDESIIFAIDELGDGGGFSDDGRYCGLW